MIERIALVTLACTLACGLASAQIFPGQAGFAVQNGNDFAGDLCGFGFTCSADTIDASPGDIVTMRISGSPGAPYLLLISAGASSCIQVPNVLNALVLDDPVVIAAIGSLDESSPILSCPSGLETLTGPFPLLPPGFAIGLQAVTLGSGGIVSFTVAVLVNVI